MGVADRLGLDAEVGAVELELNGTVLIRDLHFRRGAQTHVHVRQVRLVIDLEQALETRSRDAITSVRVDGVRWREAGDPDLPELARRLQELLRGARARSGQAPSSGLPVGPRRLPPITIDGLELVTDTRTLFTARLEGAPNPAERYSWRSTGTLALTRAEAPVRFTARGQTEPGRPIDRMRLDLDRALTVPGPRGTRVTGVRSLRIEGGVARTGPAVIRDEDNRLQLRATGIEVRIGRNGVPEAGRFRGARLALPGGQELEVRDLRFADGGRLVRLSGVSLQELERSVRLGELTLDLESGRLSGQRLQAQVRTDRGELSVQAKRLTIELSLDALRRGELRAALPDGIRLWDAVVRGAGFTAELQRLALQAGPDGGLRAIGHGQLSRRGASAHLPLALDVELTRSGRLVRGTLDIQRLPASWDPTGWGQRLAIGPEGRADLRITVEPRGDDLQRLVVYGAVALSDLSLHHRRLLPRRVGPLRARGDFRLVLDRQAGSATLAAHGTAGDGGHEVELDIALELDGAAEPVRGTIAVDDVPVHWAPTRWTRRLGIDPAGRADLSLELVASADRRRLTVEGDIALQRLTLRHWRLAPAPIGPMRVASHLQLSVDLDAERVRLALDDLHIGPAQGRLVIGVEGFGPRPTLDVHLQIPAQACRDLVAAVPPSVRPSLADLRVRGTAWADIRLIAPLQRIERLKLSIEGDLDRCEIVSMGAALDRRIEALSGRFVHRPSVAGEPVGVAVGPATAGFVSLDRIPLYVRHAALATEDRAFYRHSGFRASMIRGALKLNLKHMRYVYGGSTITQQLVKNLFLTRRKDLARKLEEAAIVVQLERRLSKRRILELYLNCIEYGPGIWGLSAASRAYYAKAASELTPEEGVYLMAIKPYPRHGWYNARRNRWRPNWVRRMKIIFERIHRSGAIDAETLEAAGPEFRPVFAGIHGPLPEATPNRPM